MTEHFLESLFQAMILLIIRPQFFLTELGNIVAKGNVSQFSSTYCGTPL